MTRKTVASLATRALARLTSFTCFGAALASLAFLSPAFAATPVAIWDNNFDDPTNGGWTLDLNGNTANQATDGGTTNSLTIADALKGITFTPSSTFTTISVIIRCSGLNVESTDNITLFSIRTSTVKNAASILNERVGSYLKGSDHTLRGLWNSGSGVAVWNTVTGSALSTSPSTLGFAYYAGTGMDAYSISTGEATKTYSASGLRGSSDTYNGLTIGGVWDSTSASIISASGLTITSIAIFDSKLSQADVESYKFPSEITEFTATEEISGEKNWSDINFGEGITWKNAAGSTATLTLAGDTVLTLPDDFQAATVTVSGEHKLTLKGGKSYFELVGSDLTAVERDVFYSTSIAQTIAANHTYIVGGDVTLSGNNTVAEGGTLKVTNGTATVTFNSTGIDGTVEISEGATLAATSSDALNYNSSTFKVNVYGTLNLSSYRWTFKGGELHLYDNAQVTGTGDSYGAIDLWNTVYAHKNTTTDEDSESVAQTMTISAPVRYTGNSGAQPTFNVEENVTLEFTAAGKANNCTKLLKTGAGTLKLSANQPLTGVSEVQEDLVELACDNALSGTTTVSAGATLKVSAGTNDLTSHTNNGTVEVAGGTVTVSSSIGGAVNWTDGVLKVKVTADQATSGLTLDDDFTITKADDANVIFVLPSGEEVTGEGKTLTAIKTWVGAATGNWADSANWSGGAEPTAEDMVIITNETVEITVAEGAVMPKTLEIAKQATLKGTLGTIALLHVDADATLTLDGVTATTASIDSGATLTINSTATVNALTGSGTLVLEEGSTLSMSDNYATLFASWSGLVKGKGALTATYVPGNATVKTMLQNSTRWQATIAFVGLTNQTNFNLNDYGNASSTIRMTGCSLYFIQSNGSSTYRTFTPTLELCDGDYDYGVKVNNGWSGDRIEFTKLTGDGTFLMAKPDGVPTRRFFFPTACLADFKGTIKMETSGNASTLYLVRGRTDYSDNSAHNGDIVIAGEIASGFKVENSVGNIVFQDGATLTASDTETAKIKGVSCEMDSGATVTLKTSLTETELKDPTVTSLPFVAWTTKPTSDLAFTIDDDTLPAKRWRLSQKSTGLYVVRKYGTMILVK